LLAPTRRALFEKSSTEVLALDAGVTRQGHAVDIERARRLCANDEPTAAAWASLQSG